MTGLHERDELNEPLGLTGTRSRRPVPYRTLAFGGCALLGAGLLAFLIATGDRLGGEPYAVAAIDQRPISIAQTAQPIGRDATAPAAPASGQLSADQVEAQSGVKVVRSGGGQAPGSLIIEIPEAIGIHLTPAPDKRLVEKSRYGLLPRIGVDGARPAEVYARPPLVPDNLRNAPRIALLVGGLGLSDEGTASAIRQLPGAVSLGFAPYGGEVEQQVAQARESGHEVLLQLPMEPFDYATDNPGPHTLLSAASEAQNLDDLHWLMGRFQGYVGVVNYLGAKFTANEAALSPVLHDIAGRGLIYVDDGSSPRSLARKDASSLNLAATGADVAIDANPKPQAIDEALTRLETLARANGVAVGMATALPVSIERVARWARGLEARGVALTPLSALATRSPGPAAQANP